MAYTFAINGDAVFITSDTSPYVEVIQDVVQIVSHIPTIDPTNYYIYIYRKYNPVPFSCRISEVALIDGKAPHPTLAGNLNYLNDMFTTAVAGIYS